MTTVAWRSAPTRLPVLERRRWGDGAAAALGALLVLSVGLTDGGYYGRATTALTVAAAATATLSVLLVHGARLTHAAIAVLAALGLLASWVGLSAVWAAPGADVAAEARRVVLYAAAFAAVATTARGSRRRPFLVGLLASIASVGLVAVAMRFWYGVPLDPYYGSLLHEPVGYPNALGVLMALGVVLAIGLSVDRDPVRRGLFTAVASLLVLVLAPTSCRGAALALLVGVVVLIALSRRDRRSQVAAATLAAAIAGAGTWTVVDTVGADRVGLALGVPAALVAGGLAGAAAGRLRGRVVALAVCAFLLVAAAAIASDPPGTTSSYRSAYWRAALAEWTEHPALGTGAGTFHLSWREHRSIPLEVRDAHSLYVEALTELGPIGLALVAVHVLVPFVGALRQRGDSLAAATAAAFAVFAAHAGIDWDWEMPVVTLAAMACAGTLLAARRTRDGQDERRR